MKKYLSFPFLILSFLSVFMLAVVGCRKEEDLTSRVKQIEFNDGIYTIDNAIDRWLNENVTIPYNIRVKYKWDRSELNMDRTMTPVDESRVIPLTKMILEYFIEPYKKEAGDYFVKRYPPKEYMYVGSAQYNPNGTVTVGTADAGKKIILFRLNEIDWNDWNTVQRVLKTIHHEFAHILAQNIPLTTEYNAISKADYVEDLWSDNTEQEALDEGFITPYASAKPHEDYAEMVAVLLDYGQEYFDLKVSTASKEGQDKLRKKEKMIKNYFSINWNINFDSLQYQVQKDMPEAPLPPFLEYFGDGLQYQDIVFDENSISDDFQSIWEDAEDEVATSGRYLSFIEMEMMPSNSQILFKVERYKTGTSGSSTYRRLYMSTIDNGDGTVSLSYASHGEDGHSSSSTVKGWLEGNIIDYLESHRFIWSFRNILETEGGLIPVDNNGNKEGKGFTGALE